MIVSRGIENNLVYLGVFCNSFLVISTGWVVIIIVSWAVGEIT